jgi:beta-lactamase regulating signal transducer with metallopeptidase domain
MTLLDHPWVATLGWALIHFLWQGLLLWLGVALSLRLLRQARPPARCAVACAGLLLCLALPTSSVLRHLPPAASGSSLATVQPMRTPEAFLPDPGPSLPPGTSLERILDAHLALIVIAWAFGAGLLALRLASGLAWVRHLRNNEPLPDAEAWQACVKRLSRALGLERSVLLNAARNLESPMAAGLWRPVIFMPLSILTGMPPGLVEALLAHELAHIKRHDYLVNLLQSAIEVLLFYHPAVWWISNRIRIEREQICDDLAAGALGEPRRLALALQELDLLQLTTPNLALAAHGGNLMSRIRRLIHPEPRPLAWKALVSILGITAACVASAAMSSSRLQDAPPPPPPPQAPPPPPKPPKPPTPPPTHWFGDGLRLRAPGREDFLFGLR